MDKSNIKNDNELKLCIVAYFFDSGKIKKPFYGEVAFEQIIKGEELYNNPFKVIVSEGDIFHKEIYNDITPFTIKGELCTTEKLENRCSDYIFTILIEDVTIDNAKKIDERIKKECSAYLGMTPIDVNSTDQRKQFWKSLIRSYSIEENIITCFGYEEEGFSYFQKAKEYGLKVNYDGFPDEVECENRTVLFSTRQSSFIKDLKQLEPKNGKNDSDRGIVEMNFSLVKEVEIAGVQIWKAIEDIDKAYIPSQGNDTIVDYIFISLYEAAQGIERLLKILIELMVYYDKTLNVEKTDELLLSHSHMGLYNFVNKKHNLNFGKNERKFLELISEFYNKGRYNRYSYSDNDIMEVELLQNFGKEIHDDYNFDEIIKHKYGKTIGCIARGLYQCILKISLDLNIYVYELNGDSVARFVFYNFYNDDLYKTLKSIENSKRELIWFVLNEGRNLGITEIGNEIEVLPFDYLDIQTYLEELVCNTTSGGLIYDYILEEYAERLENDKRKMKNRLEFIEIIGNSNVHFEEEWENDDDIK